MSKEQDFIQSIGEGALKDSIDKKFLPSLTIAQAILESAWGESELASVYHNYFGIKGSGDAGSVSMQTTEYVHGVPQTVYANFAAYSSVEAGFSAHTNLFKNGVSWNPSIYHALYACSDYKEAAETVQKCGYATDPNYANKIISIVEKWKLWKYDERFWKALEPAEEDKWKIDAMKWLKDNANIDNHSPDEMVTFAQLGAILSRIVGK